MHRQHAAEHCTHAARDISYAMHARCTAVASAACSAGILACPVTSARRYLLHQSFLRAGHADVQCVVGEEVEVGPTSTLRRGHAGCTQRRRSGQVRRAHTSSVYMRIGCVAARPADSRSGIPLLLRHVRVFGSEVDGSMTLDELHRTMWLRHAADGRPGQERDYERDLRLFV